MITRARTDLSIILIEGSSGGGYYAKHKEHYQEAADLGLVDLVPMADQETSGTRLVRLLGVNWLLPNTAYFTLRRFTA